MSQAGTVNTSIMPSGAVGTLTGNSGGAVPPTGNNINTVGTGSITVVGSPGTSTLTTQLTGLTNHSLLVGAGTATITNLGVASNGQIPIGSTGADPVLATLSAGTGISISNGAGSITISTSGTSTLNVTTVNNAQSPYTVLATDEFLAVDVTAGVVTLNFPNTTTTGRTFSIKDSKGLAATSNITLTTPGGTVTFDGNTSVALTLGFQSIDIIFDGANYQLF